MTRPLVQAQTYTADANNLQFLRLLRTTRLHFAIVFSGESKVGVHVHELPVVARRSETSASAALHMRH